ncbi:hypothetical protein L210DRAFT_3633200 [Boletus edulis BED1]|uniref:Uncharacterized protein n=1 Tax=Boletus edulis BED1 TaxID=1328754 RepID=A0AAD4BL78_BOLED|nr:hypothetical protein L210DRAFT_3633200 [Boletus edulis BED1]
MATASAKLPPIVKISMIGIWIETLLYGVNCVMYGLCMSCLLRGAKSAARRWVLIVISTVIFLLCTIHVGASLQQLLDAFVYAPADVPNYSTTYWLDYTTTVRVLKDYDYDTLVLAQDIILIWRLYVVFMCDWRVIVFPIMLAAGRSGCTYASSVVPYGPVTTSFVISAWVTGSILNVIVSGGIVARLWWIGRTIASLTATSTNRFASSIYMVIESGAITAVCSTAVFALLKLKSPIFLTSLDIITQLIVLNPLLIVVQAEKTSRYRITKGDFPRLMPIAQDQIRFRVAASREQV